MKRRKIDAEAVSDIALQTYIPLLIDAEASESTAAEEREEQEKSEREPRSGDSEEHEDDEEGDVDKFEPSASLGLESETSEIPFFPKLSSKDYQWEWLKLLRPPWPTATQIHRRTRR